LDSLVIAEAVIWIALFVLIAGPVHECAHAFTAWKLGDGTAKLFGRVTLDPIVHFDPVGGTLLIVSVIFSVLAHGFGGFGWAKPTPVNPYNLRGRYPNTKVSVAGPLSNLALAIAFAIPFRLLVADGIYPYNTSVPEMVALVCYMGVELNILLMVFNLIPIPPLDGSHVLLELLDPRTSRTVQDFMNQYGLILLIGLILVAGRVIFPITDPIVSLLLGSPY
jgi:Zn-dependent protease